MSAITITGRLAADAEARRTRTDQHLLMLRMELPAPAGGRPVVVRATQDFGTGPSAAIACRNRAHHLRRGVRATLGANAISWQRGTALLDGLHYVHTPDLTAAREGLTT